MQQAATATAQGNRPDQSTPFASSNWTMDPSTGKWTQNTSAAPGMADSIFNLQNQGSSATARPIGNGADARSAAFNSIYGQGASRLDPQYAMQEDNLKTQLANQGLQPGTKAYDDAYANFSRSKNDAYQSLTNNAVTGSGNAAQQEQQMDVNSQQAPFNTMNLIKALMTMPGFSAGPDYLGAANATNSYNLQNKQMSNQGWGQLLGGIFNLAGTAGSAAMKPGAGGGAGAGAAIDPATLATFAAG